MVLSVCEDSYFTPLSTAWKTLRLTQEVSYWLLRPAELSTKHIFYCQNVRQAAIVLVNT